MLFPSIEFEWPLTSTKVVEFVQCKVEGPLTFSKFDKFCLCVHKVHKGAIPCLSDRCMHCGEPL